MLRVGGAITLKATFRVENEKTDPTAISLEVQDPDGNITTYTYADDEIEKDAEGMYSKMITVDKAGRWVYEWQAEGAVVSVGGKSFHVKEQLI